MAWESGKRCLSKGVPTRSRAFLAWIVIWEATDLGNIDRVLRGDMGEGSENVAV
jgi:hypothetical protein